MASIIRVSLLGSLPGGEVWSVNPCFFLLDEPVDVSSSEALAIATAVNALTLPTGLRAGWSSSTASTGTRVEARTMAGVLEAQSELPRALALTGSGATAHPFQVASVTSLRTGFPGGQGRGRLYWPATGMAMTTANLRVDPAVLTAFLAGVKTYLAGISSSIAASAGPNDLAVWSRTGGNAHAVTSLRQGDVLDTQRRRRDTLAEAYNELVYP